MDYLVRVIGLINRYRYANFRQDRPSEELMCFDQTYDKSIFWFPKRQLWGVFAFAEYRIQSRSRYKFIHHAHRTEIFDVPHHPRPHLYVAQPSRWSGLEADKVLFVPNPSVLAYVSHCLLR